MDNPVEASVSYDEQSRGFEAALRIVRGFFRWLMELISLTEEDLLEAGVNLHYAHE